MNDLKFIALKNTNIFLTIFVGIFSIGLLLLSVVFTIGIFTEENNRFGYLLLSIPFWFGFFLTLDYVLWQLGGKEVITVTDDYITIENKRKIFDNRIRLYFYEIEGFELRQKSKRSSILGFYEIGGGKVAIKYLGRERRFGRDLTDTEANNIVEELKQAYKERSNLSLES